MNLMLPKADVCTAVTIRAPEDIAACVLQAAAPILACLEKGVHVTSDVLRSALESAFGGSDSEGFWNWKTAYEVCEVAQILFLRKYGSAMQSRAAMPATLLAMMTRVADLLPTHTRRTQESEELQQFSTPMPLALIAGIAAGITAEDVVLEPSAGTGMLAIFAETMRARLALNEIAEVRAALLKRLFPDVVVTAHDAANMPWEAPLQQILDSVQGPVAKIVAVMVIITTGLTLAFGETSGGFRRLIQIVFGLSIAFAASSFFLSFFSFGGGALV